MSATASDSTRMVPDPAAPALPADLGLGPVVLSVGDLARMEAFYTTVVGLTRLAAAPGRVALGTRGGRPLMVLVAEAGFRPAPPSAPGLFHTAFLLPEQADLGRFVRHLMAIGFRIDGASDHLVSEALYFDDPEGNGIEVYRDRPRTDWAHDGAMIKMATLGLDLRAVVAAGDRAGGVWDGAPEGTTVGHVHLKVADLAATDRFYRDGLGFSLMAVYPGAHFVAAGGYHHHLGLNVWQSRGGSRPAETLGLRAVTVLLPTGAPALRARLGLADGIGAATDPAGNRLVLVDGDLDAAAALALA